MKINKDNEVANIQSELRNKLNLQLCNYCCLLHQSCKNDTTQNQATNTKGLLQFFFSWPKQQGLEKHCVVSHNILFHTTNATLKSITLEM